MFAEPKFQELVSPDEGITGSSEDGHPRHDGANDLSADRGTLFTAESNYLKCLHAAAR